MLLLWSLQKTSNASMPADAVGMEIQQHLSIAAGSCVSCRQCTCRNYSCNESFMSLLLCLYTAPEKRRSEHTELQLSAAALSQSRAVGDW